jgi:hypothetical protein
MAHSNGALEAPSNVIWVVAKEKLRELNCTGTSFRHGLAPGGPSRKIASRGPSVN